MVRKKATVIIVLFLLASLARVSAEDILTLERARELALGQSATLKEALASVDAAKLTEKLQAYTLLPTISASASGGISLPSSSLSSSLGGSAGVSLKQTIFNGTSPVIAAIDSLSTQAAQASARQEYFSVLNSIDTAYYNAAKAAASEEAAQSDLESARANQAVAQAKREAGMLSPVDLMKQQATVASNEAALVAAQGALNVAMRTVASLTGIILPVTLAPVDTTSTGALIQRIAGLSGASVTGFVENLSASAAKNNPELASARLALAESQKNVTLAAAGYLPTVSMSVAGAVSFVGNLQGSANVTVSLPLDVWNVGATVQTKKVAATRAALALTDAQRTSTLAIEQAVYDTVSSAKSVSASQQALDYAQRYLESIQEQYKLATVSSADLSDAAQLVSSARSSLISAQYQFLSDLSSLRTLAGVEQDGLLVKLIP